MRHHFLGNTLPRDVALRGGSKFDGDTVGRIIEANIDGIFGGVGIEMFSEQDTQHRKAFSIAIE